MKRVWYKCKCAIKTGLFFLLVFGCVSNVLLMAYFNKIPLERVQRFDDAGIQCRAPKVNPFSAEAILFASEMKEEKCKLKTYAVINGSRLLLRLERKRPVRYRYIRRQNDFEVRYSRWKLLKLEKDHKGFYLEETLTEEFIELLIKLGDVEHREYHAVVEPQTTPIRDDGKPNVLLIIVESLSHANAQRRLRRTYSRIKEDRNAVIMKEHTIVGDATLPQMCAILTGIPLQNLPEARKNYPNSHQVDEWPLIFKKFNEYGYKTLFSEDDTDISSFQLRVSGFMKQPTYKYLRPLWMSQEEHLTNESVACSHEYALRYLKRFFMAYHRQSKFAMLVFSKLTHNNANYAGLIDDNFVDLLEFIKREGFRDNTAVFLLGDHGARTGLFRKTTQGKLEERLPFMSVILPLWFKTKYSEEFRNLGKNSETLTSHFDVHSTLEHILSFPRLNTTSKYGRSFFTDISPLKRTCSDAGIEEHWCPCLERDYQPVNDTKVVKVTRKVVEYINDMLLNNEEPRSLCHQLELREILRAERIKEVKDTKHDACEDCGEGDNNQFLFQVTFSVSPSSAVFEVTASVISKNGSLSVSVGKGISRLNKYGDQSNCIRESHPYLREFCYCKRDDDVS